MSAVSSPSRLQRAIDLIDAENAQDPNVSVDAHQAPVAHELRYARRMTYWLDQLYPAAPETLILAARCQHIRRWDIPRGSYPLGRDGYLAWRRRLYDYHGEVVAPLLAQAGYSDTEIARVRALLRKERLKADPDAQALEDVIAMVFLETEFAPFVCEHAEENEKVVHILRRTWAKMSDIGRQAAARLPLTPEQQELVRRAVGQ